MACSFSYIENSCGCLIGYNLPLKAADDSDITAYPIHALNINSVDLGEAASPSDYVTLWNGDTANQAVGTLSVGTGAYCFVLSKKTGVTTPPSKVLGSVETVTPTNFNFEYGYTALDTTGAPPTEAEYIASVDTVFTASGEVAGTPEVTGSATITVTSFGNGTDKVLFLEVDPSEAPFTLWSVVGDSLQQNQPIDATFGTGSNVWFKSTRGSDTIYLTRAQTSFGAAVIFSR